MVFFNITTKALLNARSHKLIAKSVVNLSMALQRKKLDTMEASSHIVWVDLEMTGLDVLNDKILEIACLITDKDLNLVAEGPCLTIKQTKEVLDNMNEWCMKQHNQSGLVKKCLESDTSLKQAEDAIIEFLQNHVEKKKCPLAGNSVYMDRLFMRLHMPMLDDYMHYRIIDVSSIKELAKRWSPHIMQNAPPKKLEHRSLDDIKETIEELRYYQKHFFK